MSWSACSRISLSRARVDGGTHRPNHSGTPTGTNARRGLRRETQPYPKTTMNALLLIPALLVLLAVALYAVLWWLSRDATHELDPERDAGIDLDASVVCWNCGALMISGSNGQTRKSLCLCYDCRDLERERQRLNKTEVAAGRPEVQGLWIIRHNDNPSTLK